MTGKKKLIEVALPLDAINAASVKEKSIRHGHPSTLHLWWARRPLAAARAVLFAQMVDDPSAHPERFPTEADQERERQRLFRIIEQLVLWENTHKERVLEPAREEIRRSWRDTCAANRDHPRAAELFDPERLPAFHDPFAGGGALPLEAQRLGLESHASDLNPVAVLINKAMIEIPPRFAGHPPVNPEARDEKAQIQRHWHGAQGLAEDVRYYGNWMREQAQQRIGHLYPNVAITEEMAEDRPDLKPLVGRELTVIAWLWARTVKSPNPAYAHVEVPLISSFMLSTKPGREAYLEPVVKGDTYRFEVRLGRPADLAAAKSGTKLSRGANFRCLVSGSPISGDYIKAEGMAGRMGARMTAIVAEGGRSRVYLPTTTFQERIPESTTPNWKPDIPFFKRALGFRVGNYGLSKWSDLFTPRQLVALTTLADLVGEARERVLYDYKSLENKRLMAQIQENNGNPEAYAYTLSLYLGIALSRLTDICNSLCRWEVTKTQVRNLFGRQAIPMLWDFAENNVFGNAAGDYLISLGSMVKALASMPARGMGYVSQEDAQKQRKSKFKVISTDPPYFDNVGYADLSDFFYVWLRHSLKNVLPDLFATLTVPKAEELVATPYRHGGKARAEAFFMEGMSRAMERLVEQAHPAFPVTIYYAFKQSEKTERLGGSEQSSTGWETFLEAVIWAGFAVTGTWPMRTELGNRMRGMASNALATSIVLVCRRRPASAPMATRREFLAALKAELPQSVAHLQRGNIAPVDLAQAAIGPGMAVFTRYAEVRDAQGDRLSVGQALGLINQILDEVLAEQEGDFDADSRWALAWFQQYGYREGEYGLAETLSKAKNTSVAGLVDAGILHSKAGKVRLLKPSELPADWDPSRDSRLTVWEMVHHLVRMLESGGEPGAAALAAKLGAKAETAREMAYRLFSICERQKWAQEALAYNTLVQSWPEIARLAREAAKPQPEQMEIF